ncbi:MAG TPA: methyl coenzyme M reductase system, component A2 [Candidatus Deferrimicrobium sp.]|nr:methyl coenzyme M reductase system, component A2 [Candidatus Deferrimicrobium sp.]
MTANEDFFLKVDNISKEFKRGTYAIKDISFIVNEGHSFGILGKSGSGKSVLMHALRGTKGFDPTHGKVYYRVAYCESCNWVEYPSSTKDPCPKCNGQMTLRMVDLWEEESKASEIFHAIYHRISIMLQRTFALFGEYPVVVNIQNILAKAGVPEKKLQGRALRILGQVKLTHRALHLARDLSGGEKQRAVFAMSLAKSPLLFLADEPTGTLDPITAEAVHDIMKKSVKEGNLSLVVTSHWPHAVAELTDEAILLEHGEIKAKGDPNEVAKKFMDQLETGEFERHESKIPLIKMEDCVKWYYTFDRGIIKAVNGVSLTINEGEIFGLVGVSGSGKTSLSHMLIGLRPITKGRIWIRIGDDWIDMSIPGPGERGRASRYMSILHQEYCLYPHRTVLENLTGAIRARVPEELKTKKAYDVLYAVNFTNEEIDNILYKFPEDISEGERHRVAIARVLIKEPKIVLLDEPTGTADPLTRMEIVRSLRKSREDLDQTYLIVSHDIDFILNVCDRAALMRAGKIVSIGEPQEVIQVMKEQERAMTV